MSMNKVLLVGNIGGTPRSGTTQTGHFWCNASLATLRKKKDSYETTWHKIVAWGKTAEILESCQKGDSIFIEGELNVHSYEKDGQKFNQVQVLANSIFKAQRKSAGEELGFREEREYESDFDVNNGF